MKRRFISKDTLKRMAPSELTYDLKKYKRQELQKTAGCKAF